MIRRYQDSDYPQLKQLYQHTEWYGGEFSPHRDGRKVLARKINNDPEAVWVYEKNSKLVGTISIIEDGRVAWLYRFVVQDHDQFVATVLYDKAIEILKVVAIRKCLYIPHQMRINCSVVMNPWA